MTTLAPIVHPKGFHSVCVPREVGNPPWAINGALKLLQPDHWLDWHFNGDTIFDWPNYVPMAWGDVRPGAAMQARMRAHPEGETWIVINEGNQRGQANFTTEQAVQFWVEFIWAARQIKARVNLIGPNEAINLDGGAEYWRKFLRALREAGIPDPSMHGIHMYNSTDRRMVDDIWQRLSSWQWIGKQPIYVTEVCAENQPLQYQIEVMNRMHDLYKAGKIKGCFWFAALKSEWGGISWPNCALCVADQATQTVRLTELGEHWMSLK
jgi:hypothetical protein